MDIKKLLRMNAEEIRTYCLEKTLSEEGFPFDSETLVFKVCGKMFLLLSLDTSPLQINLKCEPATALQLRERHPSVLPGYHMNKDHWNTVLLDGSVPKKMVQSWIDESYNLVVHTLPKKVRAKIFG